jgi:hypothetical protein
LDHSAHKKPQPHLSPWRDDLAEKRSCGIYLQEGVVSFMLGYVDEEAVCFVFENTLQGHAERRDLRLKTGPFGVGRAARAVEE